MPSLASLSFSSSVCVCTKSKYGMLAWFCAGTTLLSWRGRVLDSPPDNLGAYLTQNTWKTCDQKILAWVGEKTKSLAHSPTAPCQHKCQTARKAAASSNHSQVPWKGGSLPWSGSDPGEILVHMLHPKGDFSLCFYLSMCPLTLNKEWKGYLSWKRTLFVH